MLLVSRPFTEADIDGLLESAERILAGQDERIDIDGFLLVVEELMDNVVRHSGKSGGDFTIELVGEYIVARVEDRGVGIHHNMSRQYSGLSEDRAVALAFQPGMASNGVSAPRRGLSLVAGHTALASGATLCLYTGESCYVVNGGEGTVLPSSGDFHRGVLAELHYRTAPVPREPGR